MFDVPYLAGVDVRALAWRDRRERLELLAQAFEPPYELVPLVEAAPSLAEDMAAGVIEGIVLKDRRSGPSLPCTPAVSSRELDGAPRRLPERMPH